MKVFLIAGEPSGDRLGGALMAGLKSLRPDVRFDGVGGALMQAEGLTSRFAMDELSVMGIAEVLPKYRHLKRRIAEMAALILSEKPDVLITIDSPDFCLRVARRVKAASDILTVHYVAPSIWAWRPGRVKRMVGVTDHVLALLPFEPALLKAAGISCDFVGHPVVAEPVATDAEAAAFRAAHDIGDAPLVLCLPGSRRGEVTRLSPIFGEALAKVIAAMPDARVVIPCAAPVADLVADLVSAWPVKPILLDPRKGPDAQADKRAAFKAANVALAASGTVSLELAANETPMVIAYRMNWLSFQIISRMALIDTVTLVNLVSETRVVPEYLGSACKPDAIADGLLATLKSPDAQKAAMRLTMARLGKGDEAPGLRAARSVLSQLQ